MQSDGTGLGRQDTLGKQKCPIRDFLKCPVHKQNCPPAQNVALGSGQHAEKSLVPWSWAAHGRRIVHRQGSGLSPLPFALSYSILAMHLGVPGTYGSGNVKAGRAEKGVLPLPPLPPFMHKEQTALYLKFPIK